MIKFRAWDSEDEIYTHNEYYFELLHDGKQLELVSTNKLIIEQFTGLKDVNGKDIYEGDIIKSIPNDPTFELSKVGVVTRSKIDLKWCYESGNLEYSIWASGRYRKYKVIGNVHENPELLEE